MARPAIRRVATALRASTHREVARKATSSVEAVVEGLDPLSLDVAGQDDLLGEEDVTIARALARHLDDEPLEVGDTLVLVETEPGDYTAVDVLGANE